MFILASNLLPLTLILPLAAVAAHALLRATNASHARLALVFQWIYGAFLVLVGWLGFQSPHGLMLRGEGLPLGPGSFLVQPTLYLDGRNASFLILMGLCLPLIFTWLRDREGRFGASYYVSANLLSFSLCGVFISDSLLLFYLFWEVALVAAYFWIGIHGRASIHAGSVYAALIRFVLFTLAGSLPMLVSIVALCAASGNDPGLSGAASLVSSLDESPRRWIFLGFFLAFAVKLPLLGFHGWLRDTYNVAPPACRAVLSALMSKMGAYGFILVLARCFPQECAHLAPQLQVLCVAGAVYGALLCLSQDRFVDILVFSSLSHLSLIALGVFAAAKAGDVETTGLTGALFQVFNHGLIMAALFSFDARVSTSGESASLSGQSGLRTGQRRLAAVLLCAVFASASLPGLSNFAGEILILFAAFRSSPWITFFASLGALVTAAAMVRAFHKVFLGKAGAGAPGFAQASDLSAGETALALALMALWLVLGLYPMLYIHPVEKSFLTLGTALQGMAVLP